MKIAIFTNKTFTELEELKSIAEKRVHILDFIKIPNIEITSFSDQNEIKKLFSYDVVHYRTGMNIDCANILGKILKEKNVTFINEAFYTHPLFINKIFQTVCCSEAGILCPKTFTAKNPNYQEISKLLGKKFIMKNSRGCQGKHVYLISNKNDLQESLEVENNNILFQELIPNTGDFRIHTFGNTVATIYKRIPSNGDFRANFSLGGSMQNVEKGDLYNELSKIANKATQVLNLQISGIDIIQSKKNGKLYFIESNENPGWKQVQEITGTDISEATINYYESTCL